MDEQGLAQRAAWYAEESNRFGTNDTSSNPPRRHRALTSASLGSGSMDEAEAWLEYCNGQAGNTHWGGT